MYVLLKQHDSERKEKALSEAHASLAAVGLTLKDLARKHAPVKPKGPIYHAGHTYQHPTDKTLTWPSKGKKPAWLMQLELDGIKLWWSKMKRDDRAYNCPNGSFSFKITGYAWRGEPVKSPLTGRAVRPLVVTDEQGKFRAGMRFAAGGAEGTPEQDFIEKSYANKADAVNASRAVVRGELSVDEDRVAEYTREALASPKT